MNKYQNRLLTFDNPDNIEQIRIKNTYHYLAKKLTDDDVKRIKCTSFYHGIGNDISELKDIKERLQISWNQMKALINNYMSEV